MLTLESQQRYGFAHALCNGKIVLDAGCKFGFGAEYLAIVAKQVIAIDIDSSRIYACRREQKSDNIIFRIQDLEKRFVFSRYKIDVVTCFETLEHLKNPEKLIKQLPDILKENGLFIFSVPIGDRLNKDGSRQEEHLQIFETEKDIRKLVGNYLNVEFLGIHNPWSFLGIARRFNE